MVDFETKKKMRALDKAAGTVKLKASETAEVFVSISEISMLFSVPRNLLSPESLLLIKHTENVFGKNADIQVYAKRKELLQRVLAFSDEELKTVSASAKEDILGLDAPAFDTDSRQQLFKLMDRCVRSEDIRHFKTSIFKNAAMVQLQIEKNIVLLSAEPFFIHPDTMKEFETRLDAHNFLSNVVFLSLYAHKKGLYSSDELKKDPFAVNLTKNIYKVLIKSIAEKPEYLKLSDYLKNGDFWEFLMAAMKINPLYKSLRNAVYCVMLELAPNGEVIFTSLVSQGRFGFDLKSIYKVQDLKNKQVETSVLFINSLATSYYELQRMFTGNDISLRDDFEVQVNKNKLWPVEINGSCMFDCNTKNGINEYLGFKSLLVRFKDDKYLNLQLSEEVLKKNYSVLNSLFFLQMLAKDNIVSMNYYFMPDIQMLLYTIWKDKRIDDTVVTSVNNMELLYSKPFNYLRQKGEEGIVAYFGDLVKSEVKRL
ncbi:MAG: hypothetical protein V1492_00570 [Candidatus Micrarchaeota archaeon]